MQHTLQTERSARCEPARAWRSLLSNAGYQAVSIDQRSHTIYKLNEVNPVLRVLLANAIEVTAVHIHMLNDAPRLFYMHFWANDDVIKLAARLKAALDRMALANQ